MTITLRATALTGLTALVLAFSTASFADDAMKAAPMASDAMATDAMHADAMAPMSDDDLKMCLEQAGMITFPHVMDVAVAACHDMHNGMMGDDAMGGDAMAPDAMAPDAMAPAKP
ncbi:MAG: hypothetical protein ACOH2L_07015 [Devosia sp.]